MSWMHALDHDPGELAALRRRHEVQAAALDSFLDLIAGLETRFQALHTGVVALGAVAASLEIPQGPPPKPPRDGRGRSGLVGRATPWALPGGRDAGQR